MKNLLFGFLAAVLLVGCYPKGPTYVSDLDLVLTNYTDTFNFGNKQTYFLFDTIVRIDDENSSATVKWKDEVLDEIHANMVLRGYTRLNSINEQGPLADLVITTTAWSTTNTNYYYSWYDYWGWGYPGYGPGYGWGYPSYGWGYAYSYSFGTILMEMSSPADANETEEYIPLVWRGVVNGLLEGSDHDIANRIENNIDQAFDQSPYILSNP